MFIPNLLRYLLSKQWEDFKKSYDEYNAKNLNKDSMIHTKKIWKILAWKTFEIL